MKKYNIQSSAKYIWKSKKIKRHWTRAKNFYIFICVFLDNFC